MGTIFHSTKSYERIFLFLKGSICIYVAVLIVSNLLTITPVFWIGVVYSNLTVHSTVVLAFDATFSMLIYLACLDSAIRYLLFANCFGACQRSCYYRRVLYIRYLG